MFTLERAILGFIVALIANVGFGQTLIGNEAPITLSAASSPFDFSLGTSSGTSPSPWYAVCVSSTTDWDLDVGGVTSTWGGGTADFVVANGHLGPVLPTVGTASLWGGAAPANARLDYTRAPGLTMFPGDSRTVSFSGGRVIQARQIRIDSPPVTQTLRVTGSSNPNYEWFVFAPGTGPQWRARSQADGGGYGMNEEVTATFVTTGYYLWVVVLNGGAGAADTLTLSLSDPSSGGGGGGGGGGKDESCSTGGGAGTSMAAFCLLALLTLLFRRAPRSALVCAIALAPSLIYAQSPSMQVSRGAMNIANGGADNIPGTPTPGSTLFLTYEIANVGGATLNLTAPSVTNATNCNWVAYQPQSSVGPGSSTTFDVEVEPVTGGSFGLTISIGNNDPANNPYTWTISGTAGWPDLVDGGSAYSSFWPYTVVPGQAGFTVNQRVVNQGSDSALGTWWISYYLSADTTLDTATDHFIGQVGYTAVLGAGYHEDMNMNGGVVPGNIPEGTYHVMWYIDYSHGNPGQTNLVPESDETNNIGIAAGTVAVSGGGGDSGNGGSGDDNSCSTAAGSGGYWFVLLAALCVGLVYLRAFKPRASVLLLGLTCVVVTACGSTAAVKTAMNLPTPAGFPAEGQADNSVTLAARQTNTWTNSFNGEKSWKAHRGMGGSVNIHEAKGLFVVHNERNTPSCWNVVWFTLPATEGREVERAELYLARAKRAGSLAPQLRVQDLNLVVNRETGFFGNTTGFTRVEDPQQIVEKVAGATVDNVGADERTVNPYADDVPVQAHSDYDVVDITDLVRASYARSDLEAIVLFGYTGNPDAPDVGGFDGDTNRCVIMWARTGAASPRLVITFKEKPANKVAEQPASAPQSLDERLRELKRLHDEGLITDDEYDRLRNEALEGR